MIQNRQRRTWLLIATVAIGIALVCMLIPHSHCGGADGLAILPLLFVEYISPLSLLVLRLKLRRFPRSSNARHPSTSLNFC